METLRVLFPEMVAAAGLDQAGTETDRAGLLWGSGRYRCIGGDCAKEQM